MPFETNQETTNNELTKLKEEYFTMLKEYSDRLEQAEEYGKAGDPKMSRYTDRMNIGQQNIEDYAKETGEPLPDKNVAEEAERIERKYVSNVIQKEIDRAKALIERDSKMTSKEKAEFYNNKGGGYPGDGQMKIRDIELWLDFYGKKYPDIKLQDLKLQLEELNGIKKQEIENFFSLEQPYKIQLEKKKEKLI